MTRHFIVVLDDGETFSVLNGCEIIELSEDGVDKLNTNDINPSDLEKEDITFRYPIEDLLHSSNKEYENWDKLKT